MSKDLCMLLAIFTIACLLGMTPDWHNLVEWILSKMRNLQAALDRLGTEEEDRP